METLKANDEIAAALRESAAISDWIGAHHPEQIYQTKSSMVAGPCYGIAMDHREAILLLIDHNARTSAYALLRSVYESLMRGLWAERCLLNEAKLKQFITTKAFPKLEKIVQQLDEYSNDKIYATFKAKSYGAMSDYAHGGLLQLEKWVSDGEISAQHPDSEVVELLRWVNLFGLLAVWGVARLANISTGAHESKVACYAASMAPPNPGQSKQSSA